jgi:hypothetical protein
MSAVARFSAERVESREAPARVYIVFFGDVADLVDPELPDSLVRAVLARKEAAEAGSKDPSPQSPLASEPPDDISRAAGKSRDFAGLLAKLNSRGIDSPRLALAANMELPRLEEIAKGAAFPERSEILALAVGLGWGPGLVAAVLTDLGLDPERGPVWRVTAFYLVKGEADINMVNRSLFGLGLNTLP